MKSIRLETTKTIWACYATAMGLMFGAAFFGYELGAGQVVLGIVMTVATFLSTGFVWNWGNARLENEHFYEGESQEKAKNHQAHIDRLLDQMSDDELLHLRDNLRHRKAYGVGADGELVYKDGRR